MNATTLGYLMLVVGISLVAASIASLLKAPDNWSVDAPDPSD
jgi:hypothetical protein